MATGNELVITTPDGPSDIMLKQFSGNIRWSPLKSTRTSSNHLIVYFEQGHFNDLQLGVLNKLKEKVKLLLFRYKKDEPSFLFNEIAFNVSHALMKRTIAFHEDKVFSRVISSIASNSQEKLIADAYVVGNTLKVIDCAANRFEIDQKYLKAVTENGVLSNEFVIHKDGSYLHWEKYDYHINIEGLRCKIDETFRKQQSVKYFQENGKLGNAMRKMREASNLKQTDFEDISDRHLRRIEVGEAVPSYLVFEEISKRLNLSVPEYLSKLSKYIG